jgi:tetratricopeptide (TPR) repeat protein
VVPRARSEDTSPRLIVPDEATDPGMMAHLHLGEASELGDDALESADLVAEDDHARFDRLLEAYARDFDHDETRVSLEGLADRLGRWGDLLATAKRLLARHAGTSGEDRVWAQLSAWSKRAHGDDDPKTARSRLLDATFAAPPRDPAADDEPSSITEPPAFDPHALGDFGALPPGYDYGANFGTDVLAPDFSPVPLDATEYPPDAPPPFAPPFAPPLTRGFSAEPLEREPESRPPFAPDFATLKAHIEAAQARVAQLPGARAPDEALDDEEIVEVDEIDVAALEDVSPISSEMESADVVVPSDGLDDTDDGRGDRPGDDVAGPDRAEDPRPGASDRPYDSARTDVGAPPVASHGSPLSRRSASMRADLPRDSRTLFTPQAPAAPATETELPLDVEDVIVEPAPETPPPKASRAPDLRARGSELPRRPSSLGPRSQPAPAKTTTASIVRPSVPAPRRAVDPAVLETGELDLALDKATTDAERARILVERAKRELHKGSRDKAIDSYRDALAFETTNADALGGLERLYRDTKNVTRLVEILEQKLELANNDGRKVEGLVDIAELYENELGDLSGAVGRLEAAHALQPRNAKPLQALARCHEKLGDFAAQANDLKKLLRGENSRAEKLETLLRLAAVQENQLDDVDGAIDSYEQILDEHPQYKAALDDLARLGERSGAWRAKAKIIEHRVELAKEPKAQAQLLVDLGDLLAVADRDPEAARKHYERAARVFPSQTSSWRGLEQLATWSGDPARAEFYLEQRVRHTQELGARALVLIELAQYRAVVLSKKPESLAAYELAHKADPDNETAAAALLSPFVAQKRWPEAAVLCDVLYRAAVKTEDDARVSEILETSWKVASAMGNRAQMLAVVAARYRRAPDDPNLQTELLETAFDLRDGDDALRRARPALDLLLARTHESDPVRLGKLAEVLRAAGDAKAAEDCYERVLEKNPTDVHALAFLSRQAEERGDFRRAASLKERLARELEPGDDRFQLLLSAGDLWLRARGQVAAALRAYEEALAEQPRDEELLRTLLGLYADQETWDRVAPTLRALADGEADPARKEKTLLDLANVLESHLDDTARAADVLEEVLAINPKRLDAFERLVRIFTKQKDWIALANGYREMLGRLDEAAEPKLAFALHHQLGLVYRDRIGDAERALKSFTQAATLRPDNLDERKIVTELLVVTQRLDAAVDVARATLRKEPLDPQLYRDLYDLFLRAHAYDKAWCVAEAMSVLGPLDETERQFVADYPPVEPSDIPASLLATAWPTHIHHADLDRTLSSALQIAVAVYLRARLQQAPPPPLGLPLDQDNSAEGARVLAAFRNAAEVLACTMPALHGTLVPGPLFTTVLAMQPTLSISLATSATISSEFLNFLATKRLAEQQPALRARSLFPSVQELKQLFFTTTQLATSGAGPMMRPGWDGGLGAVMTPDERAALRGLVAGVATSGQKLDVKRWLQLAEVTAIRAGLLICGSVGAAQRAMTLEPRMPDDLGAQQWLAELGMYAVSEQYFELRETIHVAI